MHRSISQGWLWLAAALCAAPLPGCGAEETADVEATAPAAKEGYGAQKDDLLPFCRRICDAASYTTYVDIHDSGGCTLSWLSDLLHQKAKDDCLARGFITTCSYSEVTGCTFGYDGIDLMGHATYHCSDTSC